MKKILTLISLLLVLALCISIFAACGNKNSETTDNNSNNTTEKPSGTTSGTNSSTTEEKFDYFNEDLSHYITIDPQIYKNLVLEIDQKYEITDALLEKYIAEIVANYPDITEVKDRPIEKGDVAYIYYEGYIDGVAFSGGSNMTDKEPYPLTIGSGKFIDGFEDGLIGVVPSETSKESPAEVNCKFPDNYGNAEVAGKDAVFKVVVEYIAEETPAEFNEEFVNKNFDFDPAKGDVVEQFKALALEDLTTSYRTVALNAIYTELAGKFTIIKYPQSEVDYHYDHYSSQFESYYSSYLANKTYYESIGLSFANYDEFVCYNIGLDKGSDWEAVLLDRCKLYVEESLILFGIAQYEEFVVDEALYAKSLDYLTKYYILMYEQNYGYTFTEAQIQSMISSDMVIDHSTTELFIDLILKHATINFVVVETETESTEATTETTEATTTETTTEAAE